MKDNWSKLKGFKPSKKPEEPTKFQYRYRDANEDEWSLLHYALAYDDVEMAEFLIQEGVCKYRDAGGPCLLAKFDYKLVFSCSS